VDTRNAHERLGVPPERVVDYLGLIGDSSDNVPGGQGDRPQDGDPAHRAFGPIEEILANVEEITAKRAREALEASCRLALLSKQLVTIRDDLPWSSTWRRLRIEEPGPRGAEADLPGAGVPARWCASTAPPRSRSGRSARSSTAWSATWSGGGAGAAGIRAAGRLLLRHGDHQHRPLPRRPGGDLHRLEPNRAFYLPFRHCRPQGELIEGRSSGNLPELTSPEMRAAGGAAGGRDDREDRPEPEVRPARAAARRRDAPRDRLRHHDRQLRAGPRAGASTASTRWRCSSWTTRRSRTRS
jgi:hypothetical protein